jgi:hypothetical protein
MKKILMLAMAFLISGVANVGIVLADDVSNNLDATIDTSFEAMGLVAGAATGSTVYSITQRNGDGKNGCNLTGGTALTVNVSSSNTAVASLSDASFTFGNCNDTKTLTVTPLAEGTATITLTQVSNTTGGSFNLAPATFTVNVTAAPADVTVPVLALPSDITT